MDLGKVAKMLGQAAAYGLGVGSAVAGIGRLAGYVANKTKSLKHTWHKGYDAGYGDAVTMANAHLAALEKQVRENNELLKKAIQQSEAAE